MGRDGIRAAAVVALLVSAAACGSSDTPPAAAITPVSGNNQSAIVGAKLTAPLVVQVTTSSQTPVANVQVNWAVTSGSGSLDEVTTTTDATGHAQTNLTLGLTAGTVLVTATVSGTALSTQFTENAQAAAAGDCTAGSGTSPVVGSVDLSIQTSGLCLAGGVSGADFALIPFNTATSQGTHATVTVTATGVVALATPDGRPAALRPIQLSGGMQAAIAASNATRYAAHAALDTRLRRMEQQIVTPRMASARTWLRQRSTGALRDAIPATVHVGDLLRLNANANDPCTNPDYRIGRVAAITNAAIVVADTANPAGGFTDADYQSFGVQFDTLVNPLDTTNFGAPTDIDHNGHELIFFTRAVNELTARGSNSIIGGFMFARDLLPQTSTQTIEGCATSNVGEMFYMQVPDPNGVVNGNAYSVSEIEQFTVATLAHEYQHLINASRRIYINNANDLEVTYLNEGLSHIAEELLFYRVSGLAPRENIDVVRLRQSQASVDAFNNYQLANAGRYGDYLEAPDTSSVYADNDELSNRGAIWGFLRWAADHRGTSDAGTWRLLVNSTTTGLSNLQNVFGTDILQQIRDYATSLFADDLPGVTEPRALQPSWNWRTIMPAIGKDPYPLKLMPLAANTPRSATLDGGGSAYFRFSVPAGQTASVTWTSTTGGGVNWALVRSR
jgi:hypothetical protein